MLRSTIRLASALLLLTGLAACSDNSGPSCVPFVVDEVFVNFPMFEQGASLPFADAQFRQVFYDYADSRCPIGFSETYLRFRPYISAVVRFSYRMDFEYPGGGWFYNGQAGFNGGLQPTNEVLVSADPYPIDRGEFFYNFVFN